MESIKITTVEMPKCLMCGKQAEVRVAMENGTPPKSVDYFCKKCYVESFYEALQQQKKELDEEEGKDTNVSTIDDKWEKLWKWCDNERTRWQKELTKATLGSMSAEMSNMKYIVFDVMLNKMSQLEKGEYNGKRRN